MRLKNGAYSEIARKRIGPIQLELRIVAPRLDHAAVLHLLWGVDDVAVVIHDTPGVHSSAELNVRACTTLETQCDEVGHAPLLAVVRRVRDQIDGLAELRG